MVRKQYKYSLIHSWGSLPVGCSRGSKHLLHFKEMKTISMLVNLAQQVVYE